MFGDDILKVVIYPIILTPGKDGGFSVFVPDFGVKTSGKNLEDSFYAARVQISLKGIELLRKKESLPEPSEVSSLRSEKGEIVTLVDVDFAAFKRIIDNKTVRRNCTLPAWLDEMASEAGINVSAVLQTALKKELNVEDPVFD